MSKKNKRNFLEDDYNDNKNGSDDSFIFDSYHPEIDDANKGLNDMLLENALPSNLIDVMRQTLTIDGTSKYINSSITEPNGNWESIKPQHFNRKSVSHNQLPQVKRTSDKKSLIKNDLVNIVKTNNLNLNSNQVQSIHNQKSGQHQEKQQPVYDKNQINTNRDKVFSEARNIIKEEPEFS